MVAINSKAQITEFPYNEGFESTTFPPTDWIGYAIVEGDMEFTRVTEGEWPDCMPHDGSTAMAQYNSFNASIGEEAVLITPEMTLTDDNVVRFWFFRSEDPSNNRHDKIEVYYNSSPTLEGAIFLDSVNRAMNFYPSVSVADWYQYEFEFSNPGSTYIIFKAISAYGWKMFLDDVEINTNSIDVDPPTIISLDGTQVYAQQQMDLNLRVRDDSDMPETLDAELIIDEETTDIVLTKINTERGDFNYQASIAGQTNHTEGEIRFWLVDELNNSIWSEYYTLNWDWVQPILKEGFEGEIFPPENWDVIGKPLTWLTWDDYGLVYYTDSDNVEWEIYPPEGERQAAVEWDFQNNAQDEWMITPLVSITEDAVLSFKTFVRLYSHDYDEYLVNITTDGYNWNTIWSAADYPAGVSDYNDDVTISLEDYVGSDVRIAWQAYNLQGTNIWYSWFVDDVKIYATDTIVGINENQVAFATKSFPNPFTSNTQISFQLQKTSSVSLNIFSNDGSKVFSETYSSLPAGLNKIKVDGTKLADGFYSYQLISKEGISTGKLIKN